MPPIARPAFTPSRQIAVREDWLAQRAEDILLPNLPIVDPHHHLWDREAERYLLDDLLADTGSGHDIRATVFIQCASMYRPDGPAACGAMTTKRVVFCGSSSMFEAISFNL